MQEVPVSKLAVSNKMFGLCPRWILNHNKAKVGKDLWRSSSPTPHRAGSPGAYCAGWYPGEFWISPEKETAEPLWATCSSVVTLTVKKCSLIFSQNLLCPLPPILLLGTTEKRPASSSWHPHSDIYILFPIQSYMGQFSEHVDVIWHLFCLDCPICQLESLQEKCVHFCFIRAIHSKKK